MIAALLILTALVLIGWWTAWTVRVFAGIARNLWRASIEVRRMIRILAAPRCSELDRFLERRRVRFDR
jgi:hypothetical protein